MNSPPPKKKVKAPAQKVWRVDDMISLEDATALIASRDVRNNDSQRDSEDRARHLIKRAVKSGELSMESGDIFIFGKLIAWARTKKTLAGKFDADDTPAFVELASIVKMTARTEIKSMSCRAPDLDSCHKLLDDAKRRIYELEEEVARLRPDAKECQDQRARNAKNRRGKGG